MRIGEIGLGAGFEGVLPWGLVDYRPVLRCLHGYGLCLCASDGGTIVGAGLTVPYGSDGDPGFRATTPEATMSDMSKQDPLGLDPKS